MLLFILKESRVKRIACHFLQKRRDTEDDDLRCYSVDPKDPNRVEKGVYI